MTQQQRTRDVEDFAQPSRPAVFERTEHDSGVFPLSNQYELEDDLALEEAPTPDAPLPSIHEQIAYLPSAALRQGEVELPSSGPSLRPTEPTDENDETTILLNGAKDLLSEGDFRPALELLEMARSQATGNPEIEQLYAMCLSEVEMIYAEEIKSLDLIPTVRCSMEEIMRLNIDHRVGFLISQIDGVTTLSDLMILTGFNESELIRVIGQLNDQGVIQLA